MNSQTEDIRITETFVIMYLQVQDMFLPPTSELHQNMRYGYVVHSEQHNLFKIELESMRYTKSLDLESFACLPQEVAFIPLGK